MSSKQNPKITEKPSMSPLREAFSWERVICRLIAAWCVFTAFNLTKEGKFFDINYAQDTSLVALACWVAVLFAAFSAINYILPNFETDTWALMLGATACVITWLSDYDNSSGEVFFMLAASVVYSLFVVYFVNKNEGLWSIWNPGKKTVLIASIVFGAICCAVIAIITCYRYKTFSSPNFDFGLFVNMFHNMKETGLPLSTSERDVLLTHFAVHISPIYYLILPFYCVFPSPMTLQIAQAVVLASGVIPVMLICRHMKLSGKTTILVTFIYSLYPAMAGSCFYDIHENCFLTPLLLWVFYFFEKEKYIPMYIFAFATLMVKEDAAMYIIIFAVFLMLSKKKFLHGGILAAASLAYFFIALSILENTAAHYAEVYANASANPSISGPMINRFDNLMVTKEDGLLGAVKTALVNPGFLLTQLFNTTKNGWEKIVYALQIFLPLGFIPFCTKKPSRYLLIAPILMNLLTQYQYQYNIGFQYHFGITAFMIYVTVINLPDMKAPQRKTLISIAAASCMCIYLVVVAPKVTTYTERWEKGKDSYMEMDRILDTIPEDASVACSSFLLAHIADRDEVYELKYHGNEGGVDYIIYDARYEIDKKQLQSFLDQGYKISEKHGDLILILQKSE